MICSVLQITPWQHTKQMQELWLLLTAMKELFDSLFFSYAVVFPTSPALGSHNQAHTENELCSGKGPKSIIISIMSTLKIMFVHTLWSHWLERVGSSSRPFPSPKQHSPPCWRLQLLFVCLFSNNPCSHFPFRLTVAACNEYCLYLKAISKMSTTPLAAVSWEKWHMIKIHQFFRLYIHFNLTHFLNT